MITSPTTNLKTIQKSTEDARRSATAFRQTASQTESLAIAAYDARYTAANWPSPVGKEQVYELETIQAAMGKLHQCSTVRKANKNTECVLFLYSIGPDAIKKYNRFDLSEENRRKLSEIIKEFDRFAIGETNEIYERYIFNRPERT